MNKLPHPDCFFLDAAEGWLMLDNPREAEAEFLRIQPNLREDPDLLELQWSIQASAKNWDQAVITAQAIREKDPERSFGWIHLAYSIRRQASGGLADAWKVLRPAFDRFPQEGLIAYNLACYATQLCQLDDARQWLQRAMDLWGKDKTKFMALKDDDLAPLRDEIKKL
jgi:tetratricopeptide (TPR) repeat protein